QGCRDGGYGCACGVVTPALPPRRAAGPGRVGQVNETFHNGHKYHMRAMAAMSMPGTRPGVESINCCATRLVTGGSVAVIRSLNDSLTVAGPVATMTLPSGRLRSTVPDRPHSHHSVVILGCHGAD